MWITTGKNQDFVNKNNLLTLKGHKNVYRKNKIKQF